MVTINEMSFQMYWLSGSRFCNVWKGGGSGCDLVLGLVNKVTWKMFFFFYFDEFIKYKDFILNFFVDHNNISNQKFRNWNTLKHEMFLD
jgi:hypothetical protein